MLGSHADESSTDSAEESARRLLRGCALFGTLGPSPDSEEADAAVAELQDNTPEEAELLATLEAKALSQREARDVLSSAVPSVPSVNETHEELTPVAVVSHLATPMEVQELTKVATLPRSLTFPASTNSGGQALSGTRRSSITVSPRPTSPTSPAQDGAAAVKRRATMSTARPSALAGAQTSFVAGDTFGKKIQHKPSRNSLSPLSSSNRKGLSLSTGSPNSVTDDAGGAEVAVAARPPLQHMWAGAHVAHQQPIHGMPSAWNPWHQFYGQGMYGTGMYTTGGEQGFGGYGHLAEQCTPPDFIDSDAPADKESGGDVEDSTGSPPSSPRLPRSSRDSWTSSPGEAPTPRKKGSLFRRAVVGLKKASVLGVFGKLTKGGPGLEVAEGAVEDMDVKEVKGEERLDVSTGSIPKAPPKPSSRGSRPSAPSQAPRRRPARKLAPVPTPLAEDLFVCGELGPPPSLGPSSAPIASSGEVPLGAPDLPDEEAKLVLGMAGDSIPRVQSTGKLQSLELLRCLEDGPSVLSRVGSRPSSSRPGTGRSSSGRPATSSSKSIGSGSARGLSRGGKKIAAPLDPGLRALLDANGAAAGDRSSRRPDTSGASTRRQLGVESYQESLPPRASTAGVAQQLASQSLGIDKWQRLREESWDGSTRPQPDWLREVLASQSQAARKPSQHSRVPPLNAFQELPMFDLRLQELSSGAGVIDPADACWPPIVQPVRPGTTGGEGRATSSSGARRPKPTLPGLGALASSLKAGVSSFEPDPLLSSRTWQDPADWHVSRLHAAYLEAASSTENAAAALALALTGLHDDFRAIATSVAAGQSSPELPELLGAAGSPQAAAAAAESLVDALGADSPAPWLRLQALVERLWEELQVPEFERQLWDAGELFPRDRGEALAAARHALELVACRGSALRLMHGLCERDRALALLGPEPPKGAEAMHMRLLDSALLQGLSAWSQRFGHLSPAAPACQGRAVAFVWKGQDVAAQITQANSGATEAEVGNVERQPGSITLAVTAPQERQIRPTRIPRASSELTRGPATTYPIRVA